ncbi:hypothetical protein KAW18_01170 [candidate division WOR-3 bacterium]|nr:hypothetical protein [candidate division WOR-3 bacterium]
MVSKENTYQLKENDWIGTSMLVVDGVHFAICGFDDTAGYSEEDLRNGLQERIHKAILKAAEALQIED